MSQFRNLTDDEVHRLEATGCSASSWSDVWVAADFCTEQLAACRLEGRVRIASGARIYRSRVRNYDIGERSLVADVTALECRHASPFGNGVPVATMNEGGGRTVKIFTALSAQTAYLAALYRHRPQLVAALERMAAEEAGRVRSEFGRIGSDCRITTCRLLREVLTGDRVELDGVSLLENGTLCDGARAGIDVNTTDHADWQQALQALVDQRPLVKSYVMDEIYNMMESGEAAVAAYYAGDYFTMCDAQADSVDLQFYYPENTNYFIDAMCIPTSCRDQELAECFINFMLSREAAVANAEYIYYASPNRLVYDDPEYIDDMGEDTMAILYPDIGSFRDAYNRSAYRNLDQDTLTYVNSLWETLKIN